MLVGVGGVGGLVGVSCGGVFGGGGWVVGGGLIGIGLLD